MITPEVREILSEIEDELNENGCFHELHEANNEMIVFNYPNYWDDYPEFADQITLETDNLLAQFDRLVNAGFTGCYFVNNYMKHKEA